MPKVYKPQGGDQIVVAAGGSIQVMTGGKILPDSGTQAPVTTAPANTAATNTTPYGFSQAQANAIKDWIIAADAALKGAGIIASS